MIPKRLKRQNEATKIDSAIGMRANRLRIPSIRKINVNAEKKPKKRKPNKHCLIRCSFVIFKSLFCVIR